MESERAPEAQRLTEAQDAALQGLCQRYAVEYRADDYTPQFDLPPDWVAGWVGGYEIQATRPTLFVGASPEGEISS